MLRTPWALVRAAVRDADPLPDAELLRRFARTRDEAAFELLVWRHGPLVLGVCRRVLRDTHLAEDAFQATFLILARKAGLVRGAAAGFLHRVARRVAVRAAKRRRTPVVAMLEPIAPPVIESDIETRALIDAEIDRLPDRLRLPIVLCYLEERSTDDAARALGVPRGTVLSRLATARKTLAGRLARRGVMPAIGTAAVTAEMAQAVVRAAVGFVAGGAAATTSTILAREVLHMTAWAKAVAAVAVLGLAGLGAGVAVVAGTDPAAPAAEQRADPPPAKAADPKPAADERRAEALKRQIEEVHIALDAITDRISKAEATVRARRAPTDVSVSVLEAALHRLEEMMLSQEGQLAQARSSLAASKERATNPGAITVPVEEVDQAVEADDRVRAARATLATKKQIESEILRRTAGPDSGAAKEARTGVDTAAKELDTIRQTIRPAIEKGLLEQLRRLATRAGRENELSATNTEQYLNNSRKKQSAILERVARARAAAEVDRLAEDELRVLREVRAQLLRLSMTLPLEMKGISLPAVGRPMSDERSGTELDVRLDRMAREITELKEQVQKLETQNRNRR